MHHDEHTQIWQQLNGLHRAIAELIEIQRAALASMQPLGHSPPAAFAQCLTQLDRLQEQLQPLHQAAEQAQQTPSGETQRFVEIDVERINVIEADGTLRMALANAHRMADPVVDGEVIHHRDGSDGYAGIIFFNGNGDECGGLIYSGQRNADGYTAGGLLTFDQFKQDQVVWIDHYEENGTRIGGLHVWDRPDVALHDWLPRMREIEKLPDEAAQNAALAEMRAEGLFGRKRIFVGKTPDKEAVLDLCDAQGHVRARLAVEAEGAARLEFMDEAGQVVASIPEV